MFKGRHFQDEIIVLCVPWYLLISLSYRDLEELMAEPLPRAAAVLSQSAARTDRSAFSVPNNPQRSGPDTTGGQQFASAGPRLISLRSHGLICSPSQLAIQMRQRQASRESPRGLPGCLADAASFVLDFWPFSDG